MESNSGELYGKRKGIFPAKCSGCAMCRGNYFLFHFPRGHSSGTNYSGA